jgi:hypothetical protein
MSTAQAQEYAAMKYGVFLCQPNGKAPATRNGLKDATTDPAHISRWPDGYNLGLLPPEGVLVYDADTAEEAARAESEYPELARASRQDTPNGGAHFVLALPKDSPPIKTSTRIRGRKVDVRGQGRAYIVTEPSITPQGRYRWVRPLVSPDRLVVASPELLAFLTQPEKAPAPKAAPRTAAPLEGDRSRRYALSALQKEHDAVASAANGSRNYTLNRAAFSLGQLIGAGLLERDEVEEALRAAAETCGLGHQETEATLKSGLEAGMTEPREIPPSSEPACRDLAQAASSEASAARTPHEGGEKEPRKSQATELGELVRESGAEFFHSPDNEAFITVPVSGHRETYRLKSKGAKAWARWLYREKTRKSIGGQALQDCLNDLEGAALFDGPKHEVHVRLAWHNGDIILDLGDDTHRVVRVTPGGWHIEAHSPVKFIRPKALAALPVPVAGADLSGLWKLLNVGKSDRPLVTAYLVAALKPSGPYPALALTGEQGSAKTTMARAVRAVIDPSTALVRSAPKDARDLMIAATSSWMPCFDNISSISPDLSDALCILSTGGGFATRTLYVDDEETILSAQRPVVMTGISDVVNRSDLLDRTIILNLPRITDDKRISETEFWDAFNDAHERILGALLTAVSAGLARLPEVYLPELPRMADFALWAVACEEALGDTPGTFMERYGDNRAAAHELALDTSPVPQVLRQFVGGQQGGAWTGTASSLLDALNTLLKNKEDERILKLREWPKRADKLSGALRRYAPNLRATGLQVEFGQETTGEKRKLITLRQVGKTSDTSATGETGGDEQRAAWDNGSFASGVASVASSETGQPSETRSETSGTASGTAEVEEGVASVASAAKKPAPPKWSGVDV